MSDVDEARSGGHPARPRLPALVNLAVVGLILTLVAALALTSRQTPPPTVAEFAPQAVEQIEESLDEQAPDDVVDDEAVAAGGVVDASESETPEPTDTPTAAATPGGATPTASDAAVPTDAPTTEAPTESEPPIERARVRKCVGDPPRQTEDPQSPPCVPFFDGDNGGATTAGVTGDEIRIALPNLSFFGPEDTTLTQLLVDHFNRRYEFYGRKMVLAEFPTQAFGAPDPPAMIADAVKVNEELQAFASLGYGARDGAEHHYYDELARRGVISAHDGVPAIVDEARYSRFDPYEWTNSVGIETLFDTTGDFICTTLNGKPPVAGTFPGSSGPLGDPGGLGPTERVFGVVSVRATDGTLPMFQPMLDRMAACGAGPAVLLEDDAANLQADNVMIQMRDAGVTSVLCVCANLGHLRSNYFGAATNQGFFPEWIGTGFGGQDLDNSFSPGNADPTQSSSVFGITYHDRFLPRQQMFWYQALRESDPAQDPQGAIYYTLKGRYSQLLQLASGIQLAGPNLTAESFGQGLRAATFPNPGAGGAPQFQAGLSYARRHSGRNSASLYWYDPGSAGVIDPSTPGTLCYLGGGVRYTAGQFPTEEPAWFQDPCIR